MENWKFGPPILIGERVLWIKNSENHKESGVVRWIGKLSDESPDWTVGIELDRASAYGGTDGSWGDRKLFRCGHGRGVFLPLSRIRKEVPKVKLKDANDELRCYRRKEKENEDESREETEESVMARRVLKDLPEWKNVVNQEEEGNASSSSDDRKCDVRKSVRRRRKENKSPRSLTKTADSGPRKGEVRRPFSVAENGGTNKWLKRHESCMLEEKYIREFIEREISKHQSLKAGEGKMNGVKGNFKRIEEDEIPSYEVNSANEAKCKAIVGKYAGRRGEAFQRRDKSNAFFSFLKWFKKSKEMPELEAVKDSSVTSSPLFIRRRSSSCGSVDTLFSIATANSFAFVSPLQYQAVISSSRTAYPVPQKSDVQSKIRSTSDYENNPKEMTERQQCPVEKKKKTRAPNPPSRDISLPSTLEHKKNDDDSKCGHRRTVSESFKDKKAGYYCHVQGKRKAPLPPPLTPLYPSLSSLKSQCPSINKKKRPAPPPPDTPTKIEASKVNDKKTTNFSYDNLSFLNATTTEEPSPQKEIFKSRDVNLSPLLGMPTENSSPLPSRPWYKRSSGAGNLLKKEVARFGDKKKNKENEDWMPEVGFARRPVSSEGGHNLFNLLVKSDRNQDKKKEEKRKSQISILANISELDREAAEIVRREHAQERKLMADKDEKYYTPKKVLDSFPSVQNGEEEPTRSGGKAFERTTVSPFDEFKPRNKVHEGGEEEHYDTNAELDYYINPWNCPRCTLENPGWEKFCEACNTMRGKFRPDKPIKPQPQEQPVPVAAAGEVTTKEDETQEQEDPTEDNVEGVRRKRLAFFTSKQSNKDDSEEDETSKLKMMLKEMKDSLPKREKRVINKTVDAREEDVDENVNNVKGIRDLKYQNGNSEDADSKNSTEFSITRVQQTREQADSDANKYGAIKKTKQWERGKSDVAEAIVVTETVVLEDIVVRNAERVSACVQTNASGIGDVSKIEKPKVAENRTYANVKNIEENAGILDLSATEHTFTIEDIESITAKLEKEGAGSAEFKVDVGETSTTEGSDTLDVNRLLKKLEGAINTGQHLEAANIAKELARMKVTCSVKRLTMSDQGSSKITVDLYVEDKLTHKGPIPIRILPSMTLNQLRMKVEREWNIPRNVQRWILGKQLATDEAKTLREHGVVSSSCPLFLYIVTPEVCAGSKSLEDRTRVQGGATYAITKTTSTEDVRTLTIEEEDESVCEGKEDESECGTGNEAEDAEDAKEPRPKRIEDEERVRNPGGKGKETFGSREGGRRTLFEKREMSENLKKELQGMSSTSIRERIEKLNRAVTDTREGSKWKWKGESGGESRRGRCHYKELMQLENADLVTNAEDFECPICLTGCAPGEGVVLKDCLHTFCRACLAHTIQYNEEAEIKCPYRDENYSCESVLQQREIKSLVPKRVFEQHLAKSVSVAENNIGNAYHCKTPDCKGWCILEDNVNEFRCPVCKTTNCLTCRSIHTGMNCRQYQEQMTSACETNAEAKKTRDMLQEMVEKGEAMACPTCQVVLMKKWGCDWLKCSMCKTEICWVTRGARWGAGGKGDTSGGCRCGVNGIKCHPKCNYCH